MSPVGPGSEMAKADRYQSHMNGLRAIAVIAVIANHLNPA